MNIEDAEISLFVNYYSPQQKKPIPFWGFCTSVKEEEYKDEIETIRSETDKAKRDKIKATLPAVTISGTFTERKRDGLVKPSGLICLDLDGKDNPQVDDWEMVLQDIAGIANTAFVARSVSNQGVFVVIPLAFPERHHEQFNALEADFKTWGLVVDKACSDICRLRGISSDRSAYFNPDAEPYRRLFVPAPKRTGKVPHDATDSFTLIQKIISSGIDITGDYKNWYEVGASLASEHGEVGRSLFHQLSRLHPEYDHVHCERQYDNCLKNHGAYSIATLFYYAKQNGLNLYDRLTNT
jgi:BT4734-like, N-terminal domain/Primase C terminal 2 (PriCT-2)